MATKAATLARKPQHRKRRAVVATAYHEAGHAVAAYFCGLPIRKKGATINPTEDFAGCVYMSRRRMPRLDVDISDRARIWAEKKAIVSLAGMEAQRRFNPRSVRHYQAGPDYHSAVFFMGYFADGEELEVYLKLLRIRARDLFEGRAGLVWECVEAVAAALLNKKKLSGVEIKAVIQETIQAAVDRAYKKRGPLSYSTAVPSAAAERFLRERGRKEA